MAPRTKAQRQNRERDLGADQDREHLRRPPTEGPMHAKEIAFQAQTLQNGHKVVAVLIDNDPVAYIPVAGCVAYKAFQCLRQAAFIAAAGGNRTFSQNIEMKPIPSRQSKK